MFSPDNRTLITAGDQMQAHIWDVDERRKIRTLAGHTEIIDQVALSSDGDYALTASWRVAAGITPAALAEPDVGR